MLQSPRGLRYSASIGAADGTIESMTEAERGLRKVRYFRYDGPHHEPKVMENTLLAFVYDIPYFAACAVFPPFHLLNQILLCGGSDGGMSPGATWKSFS